MYCLLTLLFDSVLLLFSLWSLVFFDSSSLLLFSLVSLLLLGTRYSLLYSLLLTLLSLLYSLRILPTPYSLLLAPPLYSVLGVGAMSLLALSCHFLLQGHFVRCIKPNDDRKPFTLFAPTALLQANCAP